MKTKITSIVSLVVAVVASVSIAQVSLSTFELSLPGCPEGGTNSVSLSYPRAGSYLAPIRAFAADTNGNITVGLNKSSITNFVVASFASGSRSVDLSGVPAISYGQSYSFTCSVTNNTAKIFVVGELEAP